MLMLRKNNSFRENNDQHTMKTIHFNIKINASKEKVWRSLWDDANYRTWTGVFSEGSHAVSNWKEGSEIRFLTPTNDGLLSMIAKMIPNGVMSFRHVADIKAGKAQPPNKDEEDWTGAMETYTLKENNGVITLSVALDCVEKQMDYFNTTFPKALDKVKVIAEG